MNSGSFVISLDYELVWGVYQKSNVYDYIDSNILNANSVLLKICDLAKCYNINISVGIVGLLKTDFSKGIRKNKNILKKGPKNLLFWYDREINLIRDNYQKCNQIFGDSEIIKFLSSKENIELVSHTYFHSFFQDEQDLSDTIRKESNKIIEIFNALEIPFNTIIFPRNQYNEEILNSFKEIGVQYYRGIDFGYSWTKNSWTKRFLNFILKGFVLFRLYLGYPLDRTYINPKNVNGLVNVKGSYFLRPYNPITKRIEHKKILSIKKQMTKAALQGKYFHLWWHPHNFGNNIDENLEQLEEIFMHYKFLNINFGYKSKFMSDA